jgi:hypothetical protein
VRRVIWDWICGCKKESPGVQSPSKGLAGLIYRPLLLWVGLHSFLQEFAELKSTALAFVGEVRSDCNGQTVKGIYDRAHPINLAIARSVFILMPQLWSLRSQGQICFLVATLACGRVVEGSDCMTFKAWRQLCREVLYVDQSIRSSLGVQQKASL